MKDNSEQSFAKFTAHSMGLQGPRQQELHPDNTEAMEVCLDPEYLSEVNQRAAVPGNGVWEVCCEPAWKEAYQQDMSLCLSHTLICSVLQAKSFSSKHTHTKDLHTVSQTFNPTKF